jgi:FdhD protein
MSGNQKAYESYPLTHYEERQVNSESRDFVREEPLLIRVEERPYSVVMRTPGDEVAHAVGFCLSEGLVESPKDIASIGFCSDFDENSITVLLNEATKQRVSDKLEKQGFLSQTSCGICGREMIDDLILHLNVVRKEYEITYQQVISCFEKFLQHQEHYTRTRGTHAVMLFDSRLQIISKAEDVGRHNAMDKAIGALFLENRLSEIHLAVLSSRISFEMIQKAARAGIPVLISKANPTSMAVELGKKLNMTLICLDKKSGFIVPCGEKRVRAMRPDSD